MSLSSYSDLVGAIGEWLDRDDLTARSADFIRLAEVRMNRLLDDPEMEVAAQIIATNGSAALPADFGAMVSLSTGNGRLTPMGAVEFAGLRNHGGLPRYYAIIDGAVHFAPLASGAVNLVYRRRIPPLSASNPTNWLMSLAPDAYLYGSLVQASAFLAEDDRVGAWKDAFDEAIAELRIDATRRKWGAGQLAPRINRA